MNEQRTQQIIFLPMTLAFFLSLYLLLPGCSNPTPTPDAGAKDAGPPISSKLHTPRELKKIYRLSPLPEKPPPNPTNKYADDPKAAHLGQFIFYDKRLSKNGQLACVTCHLPTRGWVDGSRVSLGVKKSTRNTMSLWNVAYNRWFEWDGISDTIWAGRLKTIEKEIGLASSRLHVLHLFANDAKLKAAYQAVVGSFPDVSDTKRFPKDGKPMPNDEENPLHKAWTGMKAEDQDTVNRFFSNIGKFLEAYIRKLITRDAPFDRYVEGLKENDGEKVKALSESAIRGLKIFVGKGGCTNCHDGPNFTDDEFHNIGLGLGRLPVPDPGRYLALRALPKDPFNGLGKYSDDPKSSYNDKLRFLKTNDNAQLGAMKTGSLRNVTQTGPYMRDGRFKTLKEVVTHYSLLKEEPAIGHREETMEKLNLTESQIQDVVEFIKSLTGKPLDEKLQKQPANPTP